jgi:hypothetical protein
MPSRELKPRWTPPQGDQPMGKQKQTFTIVGEGQNTPVFFSW